MPRKDHHRHNRENDGEDCSLKFEKNCLIFGLSFFYAILPREKNQIQLNRTGANSDFVIQRPILVGSLSTRVFETRTATGRGHFAW